MSNELSHVNNQGEVSMVDVSGKSITERMAKACGSIIIAREALDKIKENTLKKGDVISSAKIAGIFGAKKTSEIIPLCYSLLLDKVDIQINIDESKSKLDVISTVKTTGKTGVEMEALMATSSALLGIYDMIKAVDKNAVITNIKLLEKIGGKSGHFIGDSSES